MNADDLSDQIEQRIRAMGGDPLSPLQKLVLEGVLQGISYLKISLQSGYSEGHIKDVGASLWKTLSHCFGTRVTKRNCQSVLAQILATPTVNPKRPPRFSPALVGRELALEQLSERIRQGHKVIVIQGEGGLGKTTLAQHFLQTQGFDRVLEVLMAKEAANLTSAERVVEEWLRQDFLLDPSPDFGINLGRLKRQLHAQRVGILIDNLEPALNPNGQFPAAHRAYVELFRILADSWVQSVTLITSRDRLCEPDLNVEHYRLPRLSVEAWAEFFQGRLSALHPDQDPLLGSRLETLHPMHNAYGGNAKAMGILCGLVEADYNSDLNAYWHDHQHDLLAPTDLKHLISHQLDRLHQLDPAAYRLLCRMGCFRFQAVPRVPMAGIRALLWDVDPADQRQVITALHHRSLVESQSGSFWLHPAIQTEAQRRLNHSPEWEQTHRQAAHFWSISVSQITSVAEALQALEAFYHFWMIQDSEAAASTLLKSRHNQWGQWLPLGSSLYRLGLIQPIFSAVSQVLPQVQSVPHRSELHNIWGDLSWIQGKIHQALACQETSIQLANQALAMVAENQPSTLYYLKMLAVDSLLSMGLYSIDLWELDRAEQLFRRVMSQSYQTSHHRWAEKANLCLALVLSYQGQISEARLRADSGYAILLQTSLTPPSGGEKTGRMAYFIQILGQTYANLQDWPKAEHLYQRALEDSDIGHYPQVKGRTLTGLAELCRHQQRFVQALAYHRESIELLQEIGAYCDLAVAYLQLGITQLTLASGSGCADSVTASKDSLTQAARLFEQMQTPQQLVRISRWLNRMPWVSSPVEG